ncbi:MAG: hypothetical protein R3290_04610 [Acidimicrobiia bacterium]|nr:hypothetical protein [Acidimicrobiia bacterium]
MLFVGTDAGLVAVDDGPIFEGRRVDSLAPAADGIWAVVDGTDVVRIPSGDAAAVATRAASAEIASVVALAGGALAGTEGAHLLGVPGDAGMYTAPLEEHEHVAPVCDTFDAAPGRADWFTPWGGPPATRSLAVDADGTVYANVHVGGVLAYRPGASDWEQTMDVEADAHEVAAHPRRAGVVAAATARGLALSPDGARSWTFRTDGLHATYCRAVAFDGDLLVVSASDGPRGGRSAVYRMDLAAGDLERVTAGLPAWFTANVDTGCLAVDGDVVVIGDASGTVYRSEDRGEHFDVEASGFGAVRAVAVA